MLTSRDEATLRNANMCKPMFRYKNNISNLFTGLNWTQKLINQSNSIVTVLFPASLSVETCVIKILVFILAWGSNSCFFSTFWTRSSAVPSKPPGAGMSEHLCLDFDVRVMMLASSCRDQWGEREEILSDSCRFGAAHLHKHVPKLGAQRRCGWDHREGH